MNSPFQALVATGLILLASEWAVAQPFTTRVSVGAADLQGNQGSWVSAISADGRFVAFESGASNWVGGDNNLVTDIYVHDRLIGTVSLVSVSSSGARAPLGSSGSFMPAISADGRFVAFQSWAANLVTGDTNNQPDIFVHDRQTATTTRVSVDSSGTQANGASFSPSISADGRFVAFPTAATNLAAGPYFGPSVFVHDRQTGATTLASVNAAGAPANGLSGTAALSADGRWLAFESNASDLVAGDTNGRRDVFLRDRQLGTTIRVSVGAGGVQSNRDSFTPSISADGTLVCFTSDAATFVAGDTNSRIDVFVYDRLAGSVTRVNLGPGGVQANFHAMHAAISGDGRWVAALSDATNLVEADTNAVQDVFVHDRLTLTTTRVSVGAGGVQGNAASGRPAGFPPSISADGRWVAFESQANNLVANDTNNDWDVFVHDRGDLGCAAFVPGTLSAPAAGTTGTVAVTAAPSCAWHAVSVNPTWLSITGGASGSGNGTISYSIAPNVGAIRSGTIVIGGAVFAVTQAGGDPTPAAPTGLFAHLIAGNAVTLRWGVAPGTPTPTGFVLEGGVTPGGVLASVPTGSAVPTFTFQAPPGSFYVRVHALNGALRSAASNEIRIHVLVPVPPSAPSNLLGLANGSLLALAWNLTYAGGAPTSLVLDVTGSLSGSIPLNLVNAQIFFGVPPGTYTLSLRATNAAGSSPSSAPVTLTFPGPCTGAPLPPSSFLAYNIGRALFLDWAPAASGAAPTTYALTVTGSLNATIPVGQRFISGIIPPGTYTFSLVAINPCGTSAPTATQTIVVP
jgi:Tol biopolymer transport system component